MVVRPIGNLGDITLRALDTLRAVDTVACEDTRHTLKLLSHFDIHKPLVSCHANDEQRGARAVAGLLDEGRTWPTAPRPARLACRTPAPCWCAKRAVGGTGSAHTGPQRLRRPCQRRRRFGADLSLRRLSFAQTGGKAAGEAQGAAVERRILRAV